MPVLLVHGLPAIFSLEGVEVSGLSIASPPSEWWPGNDLAAWNAYVRPCLTLREEGLKISERANPSQPGSIELSEVTLFLSDVDLATTALLSSSQTLRATFLAAELPANETSALAVASTEGFASSGFVYLDAEAIGYTGTTGSSFTGLTRGCFGSRAAPHLYGLSQGSGLGNPQVTDGVAEIIGLPATLWLARLDAGAIVGVELLYFGTVGVGDVLAGGGEDMGDGFVITLDHAIHRLGQTVQPAAFTIAGFAHPGNLDARSSVRVPQATDLTPGWILAEDTVTAARSLAILTGDAAPPDFGGWHPTREAFVADFAGVVASAITSAITTCALDSDGNLTIRLEGFTNPQNITVQFPWSPSLPVGRIGEAVTNLPILCGQMPTAWVPITRNSRVYVSQADHDAVPPTPSIDATAAAANAVAFWCLVFGDWTDRTSRRVVTVNGRGEGGDAFWLDCTSLEQSWFALRGFYNGVSMAPAGTSRYAYGFILTEPTTARLALYVAADNWVDALRVVVLSLGAEYASLAGAIDFDHMRAVMRSTSSALPVQRRIIIDLDTSVAALLANEAALNGFALVMHGGRVSIARIAEFSQTEATVGTIATADLDAASPSPRYEKGPAGICNVFEVEVVEAGRTVRVRDRTSTGRYGERGVIKATVPRVYGSEPDASRLYVQIFSQSAQVLGPLRFPSREVGVQTTLALNAYQIGDLVSITDLWRVPNERGGRGLSAEVAQIIAKDLAMFSAEGDGHVAWALRLSPGNLTGYAPSALVAAGGIVDAVVTLDTTTFGAGGCAGPSYTDGGASTFRAGDLVTLTEVDATSPTAATQHTVVAVSGATLTLDPAPNATFVTLAGDAVKVAVSYQDWLAVEGANRALQMRYAFLGFATARLDATHAARVYAA